MNLIAQLEAAREDNQHIAIYDALKFAHKSGWITARQFDRALHQRDCGAYLDAARMLVPEGYSWSCYAHPIRGAVEPEPRSYCSVYLLDTEVTKTSGGALDRRLLSGPFEGEATTPALALTVAALRAREEVAAESHTQDHSKHDQD